MLLAMQGPAFGTSASVFDGKRVVATASGPTFATEGDEVHILLLKGRLSSHFLQMSWITFVFPAWHYMDFGAVLCGVLDVSRQWLG